jgi:hypothetical protein
MTHCKGLEIRNGTSRNSTQVNVNVCKNDNEIYAFGRLRSEGMPLQQLNFSKFYVFFWALGHDCFVYFAYVLHSN